MLNIENWREFKISDLFDVYLSKGDIKEGDCSKGNIPLVSSGSINNGIVEYIDKDGDGIAEIFEKNKITVDMFGQTFYQPDDFYSVSHGRVNILSCKTSHFNEYIALFICSVINNEKFRFSYNRAVYSGVINNLIIRLPSKKIGNKDKNIIRYEPNWQFMEDYIKSLNIKLPKTKVEKTNIELDIENWREFKISDYFTITGTKTTKFDTLKEDYGKGIYPYISTQATNNGVAGYYNYYTENGNVLVADSAVIGYVSYQADKFSASDHVEKFISKFNMNKYIAMFLVTILNCENYRYSYGRKFNQDNIRNTVIKLPAIEYKDDDGYIAYEPDWQFMEDYIKSLPYSDLI